MSDHSFPLIFIHRGDAAYLEFVMKQARRYAAYDEVILIGDADNHYCSQWVRHLSYQDYFGSAELFAENYHHFHTSQVHYELFCFQRWFVLKEVIQREALSGCFYLDTDTLLYVSPKKVRKIYREFDIALSKKTSGHVCLINTPPVLERFCQFLSEYYTDPQKLYQLHEIYQKVLEGNKKAGICDLILFSLFYQKYQDSFHFGDTSLLKQNAFFDNNITESEKNCEMEKGVKKIEWVEGSPFCRQKEEKKWFKLHSLQFQGETKYLMEACYLQQDIPKRVMREQFWQQQLKLIDKNVSVTREMKKIAESINEMLPFYQLASALKKEGRDQEAISYFRKVLMLIRHDGLKELKGKVYYHLAEITYRQKKEKVAQAFLKECLRLFPTHQKASKLFHQWRKEVSPV